MGLRVFFHRGDGAPAQRRGGRRPDLRGSVPLRPHLHVPQHGRLGGRAALQRGADHQGGARLPSHYSSLELGYSSL